MVIGVLVRKIESAAESLQFYLLLPQLKT